MGGRFAEVEPGRERGLLASLAGVQEGSSVMGKNQREYL